MRIRTEAKCVECERVFDLLDENDADEWYYGHDCEPPAVIDSFLSTFPKLPSQ